MLGAGLGEGLGLGTGVLFGGGFEFWLVSLLLPFVPLLLLLPFVPLLLLLPELFWLPGEGRCLHRALLLFTRRSIRPWWERWTWS